MGSGLNNWSKLTDLQVSGHAEPGLNDSAQL